MSGGNRIDRALMGLDLPHEIPYGCSLIEIIGNSRVLIENQAGVCCYDRSAITVRVRQGLITITGENLELCQMMKNQLVITGKIFSLSLTDWR